MRHSRLRSPLVFLVATVAPLVATTGLQRVSTAPLVQPEGVLHRPLSVPLFEKWLTAIEQHVPGTVDTSVAEAAWSRSDLQDLVFHLKSVVFLMRNPRANVVFRIEQTPDGARQPSKAFYTGTEVRELKILAQRASALGEPTILTRAAWLHTDLTILGEKTEARSDRVATSWSQRLFVRLGDGRQVGPAREIADHFGTARTILTYAMPTERLAAAERLWY